MAAPIRGMPRSPSRSPSPDRDGDDTDGGDPDGKENGALAPAASDAAATTLAAVDGNGVGAENS